MATKIINAICNSCNCDQQQAQEFLDDEINNLVELRDLNDLRADDIELACSNLGLDADYVEYFVNVLAYVAITRKQDENDDVLAEVEYAEL